MVYSQPEIMEALPYIFRAFNQNHSMLEEELIIPKRILKTEARDWLEREFSEDKFLQAVKLCNRDRAPGPDGFSAEFNLLNLDIIKKDIVKETKKTSFILPRC